MDGGVWKRCREQSASFAYAATSTAADGCFHCTTRWLGGITVGTARGARFPSLSYVSHTNASKSCCAHSRTFKKGEEKKDDCRVGPATTAGLRKQLRTPVTTGRNLIMENRARCNASIWSLPPVIGRPRLTFSPFFFLFRGR